MTDGYVGGPQEGEAQWDLENIRGPKRAPKEEKKTVTVKVKGVVIELSKTGKCCSCGERIAFSARQDMWFHEGFIKSDGEKRYQHQGRPK